MSYIIIGILIWLVFAILSLARWNAFCKVYKDDNSLFPLGFFFIVFGFIGFFVGLNYYNMGIRYSTERLMKKQKLFDFNFFKK